jgi:low affinity Fe/Cu permease
MSDRDPHNTTGPAWRDGMSRISVRVVDAAGSPATALFAGLIVVIWFIVGIVIGFPLLWFEILLTVTGVITFITAFLIQHDAKRHNRAMMLKIDELLNATAEADNDLIRAERQELSEQERQEEQSPIRP